jgi:hypothetical protein
MIDGKAGKRTMEIPCSEGLRVPVNTPRPFAALYPNLFWARKERGEPVESIVSDWESQLNQLQTHLGAIAIRAPQVRDDLDLCRLTLLQSMRVTIADRPKDRKSWQTLFWHAITFMRVCVMVAQGPTQAAAVETSARAAFRKGLVDFEELVCATEGTTLPTPAQPMQPSIAPIGVSVQEFRTFQGEMSKTLGLIQQFLGQSDGRSRGRGRGRGRGGH